MARPGQTARRRLLLAGLLVTAGTAPAQQARSVSLSGSMGTRAVLMIDGQLRTLAPGASWKGVTLIGLQEGGALVEIDGRRVLLQPGVPASHGHLAPPDAGRVIVLAADSGGHFFADGRVNGRAARFIVDTGATLVAMGRGDAERLGIDWRKGRRGTSATANGPVEMHVVRLDSVRVGDVELHGVDAAVLAGSIPYVLLGNSFLSRFQMKRENDVLRLERR